MFQIYIHAQALDNVSDDDMYKITSSEFIKISNEIEMQDILYSMSNVASHYSLENILIKNLSSKYLRNFQSIIFNTDRIKVWLKLGTNDKDNLGRLSHIQVLLDLNGIADNNIKAYVDSFYQGLKDFSQITGRCCPIDMELIPEKDFISLLKCLYNINKYRIFLSILSILSASIIFYSIFKINEIALNIIGIKDDSL